MIKQDLNFNFWIWLTIQIPLGLIYIFTFLTFIIRRIIQKDRDAKTMFASLTLVIPVILSDFLTNFGIVKIPQILSPVFILLFDVSLAIILSLNIERLRKELSDLNQNLEKKVLERTNELNETLNKVQKLEANEDHLHYLLGVNLSNSINEINNLCDLLVQLEFIGEDDRLNVINQIHRNSKEVSLSIENLIAWAKFKTNQINISKTNFSIKELFSINIGILKEIANQKEVFLKFDIEDKEVFSDPEILGLVYKKIISNAIDYSPKNGNVFINIHTIDSFIIFSCKDEGRGMDSEKAKQLENDIEFDTLNQTKINAGLGIKLTNIFIRKLNGSLKITSEIGKGTEVIIKIPISNG